MRAKESPAGGQGEEYAHADYGIHPDFGQADRFLQLLDEESDKFTFQVFDDVKPDGKARKELAAHAYLSLDQAKSWLIDRQRKGCGAFVTVNETDGKGRKLENIVRVRAFFVDLDNAPIEPIYSAPLQPHFLVQSGRGWHAYWLVENCPLEAFEAVQHALADLYGGDHAVSDRARVMRLPGFWHQKGTPIQTRLIEHETGLPSQYQQFIEAFGINPDAPRAKQSESDYKPSSDNEAIGVIKARKIALEAAMRTVIDTGLSRHGEIYKASQFMRRDGIPKTPATVQAFLETFEANMRQTNTSGEVCGMDWELETKTMLDPPSAPDRPGTRHDDRVDVSGLVYRAATAGGDGAEADAATASKDSKQFPLEYGECLELINWSWHAGAQLPEIKGWPRTTLGNDSNYTAPFIGLAAKCRGRDQFMPAVEQYLPKRAAMVARENEKRMAAGQEPQPDISEARIIAQAEAFLDALVNMDTPADNRGKVLLRKLSADGKPPRSYDLLTEDQLAGLPPLTWRIKGVLPATGLAAVYGAPGAGKSFLVLDMAFSVDSGGNWFGNKVNPSPVIYCALEGEAGIQGRVRAYRQVNGGHGHVRFMVDNFSLLSADDRAALVEAIETHQLPNPVVILDTLNRATPGSDENSSADMGLIIAGAKEIQSSLGGLVILVHHSGKDATKGLRGSSALLAALDVAVEVNRDGDRRSWKLSKSKDGQDGMERGFSLTTVETGIDDDGDAITSCIVGDSEHSGHPKAKPLSGDTRACLESLVAAMHAHGTPTPPGIIPGDIEPQPAKIVQFDAWKQWFFDRHKSTATPGARRTALSKAISELKSRNAVQEFAGFVWPTPHRADEAAHGCMTAAEIAQHQ